MKECTKIPFDSAEEAETELRRIIETCRKPWTKRDKKPTRVYVCTICSTEEKQIYHLTSKPFLIEYKL